jgi:hypothetical protein
MSEQESEDIGRLHLRRARFFLDRVTEVEIAQPFDRFAAESYLYAAMVFSKATLDWMKQKFGEQVDSSVPSAIKRAGKEWLKSTSLHKDPICRKIADFRDIIVHEDRSVELLMFGRVTIYPPTAIRVISIPGHEEEAERIRDEQQEREDEYVRTHLTLHSSYLRFDDPAPEISEPPAVEVVRSCLNHLERVLVAQSR